MAKNKIGAEALSFQTRKESVGGGCTRALDAALAEQHARSARALLDKLDVRDTSRLRALTVLPPARLGSSTAAGNTLEPVR